MAPLIQKELSFRQEEVSNQAYRQEVIIGSQAKCSEPWREYLKYVKKRAPREIPGIDPATHPAYTSSRNRVRQFMEQYGLEF